jgi:hypothetical protein
VALPRDDDVRQPHDLPPELAEKDRRYREASHNFRNEVVKLQASAKQVETAFDELARRWE